MNYFSRIIRHYITLALERANVPVTGDMRSELDGAMVDLDAFITARIREEIALHEGIE